MGFWRDDDGLVGLVGVAHTTASGCAAFVLPEGFRPARDLALPVVTLTRGDYAVRALRVGADGAVHPLSGTTQIVHFDGVCFYAAGVRP